MRWMLQGAVRLTRKNPIGELLDIIIDGDRILSVGSDLNAESHGVEIVHNAHHRLVIPGLVNAHLHSHERFNKGLFDNLPLEVLLGMSSLAIAERDWTPRECYLRTRLSCIEMIKSGTTMVIDDFHPGWPLSQDCLEQVFRAYEESGMRSQISIACADKPFYQTIPFLEDLLPQRFKKTETLPFEVFKDAVFEVWHDFADRWNDRVQFVLSPSGPHRCSTEFLKATWELSEKMEIPVLVQVLETKVQKISGPYFYGQSIVDWMNSQGLLTPLTVLIHCVWVTDHDIEIIARTGAKVVHNPISDLKLGSGVAPVLKMAAAGIPIGLGTDNLSTSETPNLFEAMKMTALLHRSAKYATDKWMTAETVMRMASYGGASCGNIQNEIGELAPGMKADFILIDLDTLSFLPRNNLTNQLVYTEHGGSVEAVVVDGKFIMKNRTVLTMDEAAIIDEYRQLQNEIYKKLSARLIEREKLESYLREAHSQSLDSALSPLEWGLNSP